MGNMARDRALTPREKWAEKAKEKLIYYILSFVAGGFIFYLVFSFVTPLLYPSDLQVKLGNTTLSAQKALEYAKKLRAKAMKSKNFKEKQRLEELADRIEEGIASSYPVPSLINLLNPKNYPKGKVRYWLLWAGGLGIVMLPWFYFFRKARGEWRSFFMREAVREPPIDYGKARDFIKWEYSGVKREDAVKTLFGSEEQYREVLAFFDANIVADNRKRTPEQLKKLAEKYKKRGLPLVIFNAKKISQEIGKHVDAMAKWGTSMGFILPEQEKHFRMIATFVLFHYVAGLYGNIPAGFLVTRIKDYTLKRVISVYHMKKRIITNFKDREVEEDKFPSAVLDTIHTYKVAGEISVFEDLRNKFNPLPFVLIEGEGT